MAHQPKAIWNLKVRGWSLKVWMARRFGMKSEVLWCVHQQSSRISRNRENEWWRALVTHTIVLEIPTATNLLERAIAAAWQLRVLFSLMHISLWTQYVDHRSSSQIYWNLQVFYNEWVSIINKCVTICKQRVKMWIGIEIVQLNGSAILW